ncbi:hypothetical protein QU39_00320, partial [Staphylococcus aureus]
AHGSVHSRQDHSGAQESHQPVPDLDLSPDDPRRTKGQDADHLSGACRLGDQPLAGPATRNGVYAEPQRGHADVHADDVAGPVGDQGGGNPADAEQGHQDLSGSRVGLREGGTRRNGDRPRADRNVRDDRQSQTQGAMACGPDRRRPHRRTGQGFA